MRLVFTGGGTLGSVTPLLALYEELVHNPLPALPAGRSLPLTVRGRRGELHAFWIGTYRGIERELVMKAGIPFRPIVSGKFRRYLDWRTIVAPFAVGIGFVQAFLLLVRLRPTYVVGAGGYVAVPVIWAAWFLRIPSITLQMDVRPGFANRLIVHCVSWIGITFSSTARFFPAKKVVLTGAPVRKKVSSFKFQVSSSDLPMLLVLGGGTGSLRLNEIVVAALPELTKICRVVHVTGKNKLPNYPVTQLLNYQAFEFLTEELFQYYEEASLVVTRAGMGTLSELAFLAKPAIVVPLPGSAQEENAAHLARHEAAIVIAQDALIPEKLFETVKDFLSDMDRCRILGEKLHTVIPTDGAEKIAQFIIHNS